LKVLVEVNYEHTHRKLQLTSLWFYFVVLGEVGQIKVGQIKAK